jgi:hypothetical protein
VAQNRAGWPNDKAVFVFEGCSVRISAEITAIMAEDFRGLLQSLQAKDVPNQIPHSSFDALSLSL